MAPEPEKGADASRLLQRGTARLPTLTEGAGQAPLPSAPELSRALAEVDSIGAMRDLHEQAAAWEQVCQRHRFAFEEVARIAEFRIRLERKMGAHLAQTVRPGGHGSKSGQPPTAGLPPDLARSTAANYRKLALVPEATLELYLLLARERMRLPSSRGLLAFATASTPGADRLVPSRQKPPKAGGLGAWHSAVIDAVRRFLHLDVLVGGEPRWFPEAKALSDLSQARSLRGDVLVAACPEPETWLPKLAGLRMAGVITQVVVFLPGTVHAPWFKCVEQGKWLCCFPSGPEPLAVAYHGSRTHGFWTAFQQLGPVLHPG